MQDAVLLVIRTCSYGQDKKNLLVLVQEREGPYVFRPGPKPNILDYNKVMLGFRCCAEKPVGREC